MHTLKVQCCIWFIDNYLTQYDDDMQSYYIFLDYFNFVPFSLILLYVKNCLQVKYITHTYFKDIYIITVCELFMHVKCFISYVILIKYFSMVLA